MDDKQLVIHNKDMSSLDKAAALYESSTMLRALVQLVPSIGSSTDFLISKTAQDYVRKRHNTFFLDIYNRLEKLEHEPETINNEHLFDLINQAYSGALKTHSTKKIRRFSKIVSDFIIGDTLWDEIETLNRFVDELSDIHIQILLFANRVPQDPSTDGLPVFYISKPKEEYAGERPIISNAFPMFSEETIRMFCSELISKNLLFNEGDNRPYLGGKNFMRKTDLTDWFLAKIIDN